MPREIDDDGYVSTTPQANVRFLEEFKRVLFLSPVRNVETKKLILRLVKEALEYGPRQLMVLQILYPWISLDDIARLDVWRALKRMNRKLLRHVLVSLLVNLRSLLTGEPLEVVGQDGFFNTFGWDRALCEYFGIDITLHPTADMELQNGQQLSESDFEAILRNRSLIPVPIRTMYEGVQVFELRPSQQASPQTTQAESTE
jgi:hypothetical protein